MVLCIVQHLSHRGHPALGVELQRLPGVSLVEAVLDVPISLPLHPGVSDPGVPELDHLLTSEASGRQQPLLGSQMRVNRK